MMSNFHYLFYMIRRFFDVIILSYICRPCLHMYDNEMIVLVLKTAQELSMILWKVETGAIRESL